MQSPRTPLRFVFCILALSASCWAEKGYLVVQVADIHNQPAVGVELAAKGFSESGTTDRFGRTRIKLDSQVKVNDWVAVQIVKSPAGKDLVLISPWDANALVPPFDNETVNFLPVVVASRSDRALLENGTALTAIAAQINKANSPKSKDPTTEQQRREALATIANTFGLAPDDVDKAIRAWGVRTIDPYEKGLAALYEKKYPLASNELSLSLEMREKELAKAQSATADSAFFLGQSKFEEGKYRESAVAYRKALNLRPDDSTVVNNLGVSLALAGDYTGAEPLSRRALAIEEKALGPDNPRVGVALSNLAELLKDKGDYVGAEPLFRRALAISEKALGPDNPNVARDLNNLADLMEAKGDYTGAEPLLHRSLAISEKALGPDSHYVAVVLSNLAHLLEDKGDYVAAEPLYRRALAIDEKALGPDHPDVAIRLNNLALLLNTKGDYSAAEPLLRRALRIQETALGPDHPTVSAQLNNLAVLLKNKGDYSDAEPLLRRALAIAEKALGPVHPTVGDALNNLAELLEDKGDYPDAEPLLRRALAITEKALGADHPSVGIRLNNMAGLLEAKGDYAAAEPLYRRALAIDEKALGPDHPTTRTIRENLAALLEKEDKAGQPK